MTFPTTDKEPMSVHIPRKCLVCQSDKGTESAVKNEETWFWIEEPIYAAWFCKQECLDAFSKYTTKECMRTIFGVERSGYLSYLIINSVPEEEHGEFAFSWGTSSFKVEGAQNLLELRPL